MEDREEHWLTKVFMSLDGLNRPLSLLTNSELFRDACRTVFESVWWDIEFKLFGVPIEINPPDIWPLLGDHPIGAFKKIPKPGVFNPKRWGGHLFCIEIGSRG